MSKNQNSFGTLIWGLAIGLSVIAIIAAVVSSSSDSNSIEPVAQVASKAVPRENKFDAYGMCCQFVKNQYNFAEDFHFKEAVEMGTEEWIISGTMVMAQVPRRWTAQIKHTMDDKWQLVYPIVYN